MTELAEVAVPSEVKVEEIDVPPAYADALEAKFESELQVALEGVSDSFQRQVITQRLRKAHLRRLRRGLQVVEAARRDPQ